MPVDIVRKAREVFAENGPNNPLNRLSDSDKVVLWAFLTVYKNLTDSTMPSPTTDHWEGASKIATQSKTLATRIKSMVFQGEKADLLAPYMHTFQDLPAQLDAFSNQLGGLMNSLGKPGQKSKVFPIEFLIAASEFVKNKTGNYQDEHLAELFQAIGSKAESKDFSGDAIRKKRKYFRKEYPLLYASALEYARKASHP